MGDFAPLGYSVAFLVFIGLFMPFLLGFFIDVGSVQLSPMASSFTDIVEYGFEIDLPLLDPLSINPFLWLGTTLNAYLVESITYLGLFPDWLIALCLIMCTLGVIYSIIKILPFFG